MTEEYRMPKAIRFDNELKEAYYSDPDQNPKPAEEVPPQRPTFIVDWDGVCQTAVWPEWGEWLPGAVTGLRELGLLGEVRIHSSRLNPYKYGEDGITLRKAEDVETDVKEMRWRLDMAGLDWVKIHDTHGKPSGQYYIDDRAIRFNGTWESTLNQVTEALDRHPNSARFHELLGDAGATHDRKQKDYGRGNDPFANVRASEEWGVPGWVGAMVRLNDKVRRLQTYAQTGSLSNEGAFDSLMDIAVYALISFVLLEQDTKEEA